MIHALQVGQAGRSILIVGARFSTTDQTGGAWTLSNGDRSAAEASSSVSGIRTVNGHSVGKWYWEVQCSTSTTFDCTLGIRETTEAIGTAFNAGLTCAMRSSNAVYVGTSGATAGTGVAFVNNDRLMFALNMDNRKLWIGKNGTWANSGDPGADTNPLCNGFSAGTWKPYIAADNTTANHSFGANFGQTTFSYTVPTGFERGYFS